MSEVFDLQGKEVGSPDWVVKYCINRLASSVRFPSFVRTLQLHGGIGGDVDWGIHRWDENTLEDYGVPEFDGYRCYVGRAEHGLSQYDDIDAYIAADELRANLKIALSWYLLKYPEGASDVQNLNELELL